MFKAIIIAGLLVSQAVLASPLAGGGKARLKRILSCEGAIVSSLSPGHQELFGRLQDLFNKYDLVSSTAPDFTQANMGMSIATFHAELHSLAQQILEKERPRDVQQLAGILDSLEKQVASALNPPSTKQPKFSSAGKGAMETRHFGEDWAGMPTGPHDYNLATPPSRLPPQAPPVIHPTPGWGYRPDWPPREKP